MNQKGMEQIERVLAMEDRLNRVSQAVIRLSAALEDYADVQDAIRALSDYYGSDDWKQDLADDEQGLLPRELRRGVLSEDGIWNLLSDCRDLSLRMKELSGSD